MPKHLLRASIVAKSTCKSYKPVVVVCQKARKGEIVPRANLKKTFNNNETTFIFDKYVTKLQGVCNVLDKYGVPLYE